MRIEQQEKASTATFKCPTCGSKVLVNTGYCMKCKKKVKNPNAKPVSKKKESIIDIKENVLIKQEKENIILEKGDKIEVMSEKFMPESLIEEMQTNSGKNALDLVKEASDSIFEAFSNWENETEDIADEDFLIDTGWESSEAIIRAGINEISEALIKNFNQKFKRRLL